MSRAPDRQPPHGRRRHRTARVLADWREGKLTLQLTSQNPHSVRLFLASQFGMSEDRSACRARRRRRLRRQDLQSTAKRRSPLGRAQARPPGQVDGHAVRGACMARRIHGRDQIDYVRIGAKRDGKIDRPPCPDHPATSAPTTDPEAGHSHVQRLVVSGCYRFPGSKYTAIVGVFTNKLATDAIRGAGRPEATHFIEVTMDALAEELGMDALELRRRNFITKRLPDRAPARARSTTRATTTGRSTAASSTSTWTRSAASRPSCARTRRIPRRRLLDVVEICGLAPSRVARPEGWGMQAGFFESAEVRVHADRSGHRLHRHAAARPGPRDRLRADRGRPARRHAGRGRRDPRRHRHRAVREEHLRLALIGGRRRGDRSAPPSACRTRRDGSWRTSWRRRRRTSSSPTASSRCGVPRARR